MAVDVCPTNVAPPMCCQPPLSDEQWAEATRRLRAAGDAVRARFPTCCPRCGNDAVVPLFVPEGAWQCDDRDCEYVWEVAP